MVIEPIKGFYKRAVIVLDFSSLYPKEAISHNLCYTTWVPPWKLDEVPEEDRIQTPAGHWFVKPHVRRGLVPEILKRLLAQRSLTRSAGTKAEADGDMITATSLDTRQLQYKVSANSMYGFMGSDASLPCFAVSESITAYGRQDILATKDTIESRYPGYRVIYGDTDSVMIATPEDERMEDTLAKLAAVTEAPAAVSSTIRDDPELLSAFRRLYGENASEDQVLAEQIGPRELLTQVFEMASRVHAIDTMHKMAKLVNESFREDNESVMEITAEKVYTNYLLLSKKRYSAMFWTKPERPDKHDSKGLENVRRDFAPITSEAVDGVLKRIVRDGDVEAAIHYACEVIGQVVSGDIDFNKLIISKKFSRPEKDYTAPQPHIHTNKKVKRRDPGREKLEGDRIEYVITSGPEKTYERAEDPRYVLENNVQVDYKYYYEKQLLEPLHRLFKRVLPEHRIQSEIFNGPHMRRRKAAPIRKDEGGIGRFVVATKRSYDDSTSTDANNANACKEQHAKDSQQQPRLVLTALPTRPTLRNNTESLTRVMRTMSTDERNVALEESFKASAVASVVAHNPFSRNRRRRTTTARSRKSSSTAAKRKKTAATTKLVKRSFTVEEMANVPRVPMPQPDVLHPFVLMADCDNDDLIDQHQDKRLCTQQTDEEMTDYI